MATTNLMPLLLASCASAVLLVACAATLILIEAAIGA